VFRTREKNLKGKRLLLILRFPQILHNKLRRDKICNVQRVITRLYYAKWVMKLNFTWNVFIKRMKKLWCLYRTKGKKTFNSGDLKMAVCHAERKRNVHFEDCVRSVMAHENISITFLLTAGFDNNCPTIILFTNIQALCFYKP